jgi:hypothetical protein
MQLARFDALANGILDSLIRGQAVVLLGWRSRSRTRPGSLRAQLAEIWFHSENDIPFRSNVNI